MVFFDYGRSFQCGMASTMTGDVPYSHVIQAFVTKNVTTLSEVTTWNYTSLLLFVYTDMLPLFHVEQKPSTDIFHSHAWLRPTQAGFLGGPAICVKTVKLSALHQSWPSGTCDVVTVLPKRPAIRKDNLH